MSTTEVSPQDPVSQRLKDRKWNYLVSRNIYLAGENLIMGDPVVKDPNIGDVIKIETASYPPARFLAIQSVENINQSDTFDVSSKENIREPLTNRDFDSDINKITISRMMRLIHDIEEFMETLTTFGSVDYEDADKIVATNGLTTLKVKDILRLKKSARGVLEYLQVRVNDTSILP